MIDSKHGLLNLQCLLQTRLCFHKISGCQQILCCGIFHVSGVPSNVVSAHTCFYRAQQAYKKHEEFRKLIYWAAANGSKIDAGETLTRQRITLPRALTR